MRKRLLLLFLMAVGVADGAFADQPRYLDSEIWPTNLLITAAYGDEFRPGDPAAQAELVSRAGLAEELITQIAESAARDNPGHE